MDIKLRKKKDKNIKVLDRIAVANENFKENIVNISTKDNNQSTNEIYSNELTNIYNDITSTASYTLNNNGKKTYIENRENINKLKKENKKKINKKNNNKIKTNKIKIDNKSIDKTIIDSKKNFQIIKQTNKKIIKGVDVTLKTSASIVKKIIASAQSLINLLITSGGIAILVIIIICMIAILLSSFFGIFFINETNPTRTMTSVIVEVNQESYQRIQNTKQFYIYNDYVVEPSYSNWKEVIAIYAVKYSKENQGINITTLDELNVSRLKSIYWQMNQITTYFTDEKVNEFETRRVLHLKVQSKSKEEMMNYYKFTEEQKKEVNNLLSNEYETLWQNLIYGSNDGNTKIVEIARQQIGNKGGEKYWRWYGFIERVDWCAIFVSWVANEANVLNLTVPKFSLVSDGVNWYKLNGRWKENSYIPNPGDVIFFDWEEDKKVNHVGLVEKVEGNTIYTIEGNSTGDQCLQKDYDIDDNVIYGYGKIT